MVWNYWDKVQRSRLLAVLPEALKQRVLAGLGQMAETVTQWTRQVGEWVDETLDNLLPEMRGGVGGVGWLGGAIALSIG